MTKSISPLRRIAAAAIVACCAFASAAWAETIALSYNFKFGPLNPLQVHYRMELAATGYRAHASADTRGLAYLFSGYALEMDAAGKFENGRAKPSSFDLIAKKDDKKARLDITWSFDDVPQPQQPSDEDLVVRQDIDTALTSGIVDPLAAVLRLAMPEHGKPCRETQRVFSGRDVYDLRFSFLKRIKIGKTAAGIYHGFAYRCRMLYVPIAGRAALKFKQSGAKPPAFDVLFAAVPSTALGQDIVLPVAASGRLLGRRFKAYTTKAVIGGRPLDAVLQPGH